MPRSAHSAPRRQKGGLPVNDKELAVIIAAYQEEDTIEKTVSTVDAVLNKDGIPHTFILVNDGSRDATWDRICALEKRFPVRGICFARNFGKEAAVYAGLQQAADFPCCVVMDADLQHPPEKIAEMVAKWEGGAEIVEGIKESRQEESGLNRFCANLFYSLISRATGMDMSSSSDFKLLDRKVVLTLVNLRERNAFFRALTFWTGYRTDRVTYKVAPRIAGETKWSFVSLVKYSIRNITSFTTAPMQIVTLFGFLMLILAVLQGIEAMMTWLSGRAADGFTTVILLLLFIGSMIMISLGIIGCYIGEIYQEVKGRPRYVIEKTLNIP